MAKNLPTTARKETDPEFQMGQKRKRTEENDQGMDIFGKNIEQIDQSYPPKQGMIDLMLNISTKNKHYQHVPGH